MAALNFTPISLYHTTTAAATPSAGNLVNGELALNITDEKLYFKNAAGVVKLLASNATVAPVTTVSFGSTGLTPSTATSGAVTVAGTLAIGSGGTGQTTAGAAFNALSPITTTGDLILGNGTNSATRLPIGSNGFLLTSNGTTASWQAAPAGGVSTFSAGTTGLTPSTATTGAVTLAGTLATANGGTNLTSFTSGGVLYATSTSALTTGSALQFNGTTLGVGVTPSAWSTTTQSAVQVYTAAISGNGGGNTASRFTHGCYLDGSTWRYQYTGVAPTRYEVTGANAGSTHAWSVAAGGTLGDAITFTEVMSISSAGVISDQNGKLRAIPQSGSAKTSSYTLATTDLGEYILLGASGSIVIPDATFATGDVVSIFNNTGSTATITCTITTAYIAGTFTDKATMTLAAAGVATILFITGTTCVVSGNVT